MFSSVLVAAAVTFTASATGVPKGTPVEFAFVGKDSDRDYEAMFLLDEPIDAICERLEREGLRRGRSVDLASCRLWPVGCRVSFSPSLTNYISRSLPANLSISDPVYTGGARDGKGRCVATTNMPAAFFSFYSVEQSPIVFEIPYEQGAVYQSFLSSRQLKKGEKVNFSITWDNDSIPRVLRFSVKPGNASDILKQLKIESEKSAVDVLIAFDENLTVAESVAFAKSLSTIDSTRVKINGCDRLFYRSFLPLVKWTDRQERMVQPFELTVGDPDRLVFIDEDWSGENIDPKLTPHEIPFTDAKKHSKTDTCFLYATSQTKLFRLYSAMDKLKGCKIMNWYVFVRPDA